MVTGDDLTGGQVEEVLPGRAVRTYPALLSTEADALAWARADAPDGALVLADYQAAPRGRGGMPWTVRPGEGLGFSLVLRPNLPTAREGWLYVVVTCALADTAGPAATIEWPDEVYHRDGRWAATGVHAQLGPAGVEWVVVTVFVPELKPPRAERLREVVRAIEARREAADTGVVEDYRRRCATIGRRVRARLVPMGPSGPVVEGVARDVLLDGSLTIETPRARRVAVRPNHLGVLETDDA